MPSHLSDEAVAAFADGVLRGHARVRAARHVDGCQECRHAVRAQREAVFALRQAPAPSLPAGLFERLQGLPDATAVPSPAGGPPAHPSTDGRTLFAAMAPMAAFAPQGQDGTEESAEDQRAAWGLAALLAARSRRRG